MISTLLFFRNAISKTQPGRKQKSDMRAYVIWDKNLKDLFHRPQTKKRRAHVISDKNLKDLFLRP